MGSTSRYSQDAMSPDALAVFFRVACKLPVKSTTINTFKVINYIKHSNFIRFLADVFVQNQAGRDILELMTRHLFYHNLA